MTQAQTEATPKLEILSARQVIKRTGLPSQMIYSNIAKGKIPVIRSGKTMYINYTALCEQLSSGEGAIWK